MTLLLFREPFKGRWLSLDHLQCTRTAPSGMSLDSQLQNTPWTLTVVTVSAFYLFWEFIFSLWKGKGNLFDDSIPKWGSHWSYVCAWMYVYEIMCGCVCAHESVEGVALAPLVLSVKLPWRAFLFSDAPLWRQTQLHFYILFSFPCWQLSLPFVLTRRGKTKCATSTLLAQISSASKRTFFLAAMLRAPLCSVILFDRPPFDPDKKAWGSPLEALCGYDVTSEYFLLFGQLQRSCEICIKGPAVLTQSSACNIFTYIFLSFFTSQLGLLVIFGDRGP